jgi:hypothetical protein
MPQPTSGEPVNVIMATSSCSTSALDSLPGAVTTLSQPAGRPASAKTSASIRAVRGVAEAGLSTTGQPAAIAGATLWQTRLSGKLNGEIAPMTPIGTRSVQAIVPSPFSVPAIGTVSPVRVRAAMAA